MTWFEPDLQHANPHGIVIGVPIPNSPEPVPDTVLQRLPGPERDLARSMRGFRQVQFVGGRIALRAARRALGASLEPVLSDERGRPVMPPGIVGSVSHKRTLAVAMVASADGSTLGADIEDYGPERLRILDRILRPEELEAIAALPDARKWIAGVVTFSLKESIYKALDPYVSRYVDFQEAFVETQASGRANVELHLTQGEGPFRVDARYEWWEGRILTSVRIRRA